LKAMLTSLDNAIPKSTPAAQIAVRLGGDLVLSQAYGWLEPESRACPANRETLFDLASLTKLFTTTAFMTLVEEGKTALDQPVCETLPAFTGQRPILGLPGQVVDAGQVTFRNLLIHNAGFPAELVFDRPPNTAAVNPVSSRAMALSTYFANPTGAHVIYSDIGLILLGMAVEALAGMPLDAAIRERVTGPLGLSRTRFIPIPPGPDPDPNIAPTEICRWRGRRVRGEVHDENAWRLGGVAGHAGLFSTAEEIAAFGQMYLDSGKPLLHPGTVTEMTREQAAEGDTRRGIGFHLRSSDPQASSHAFGPRTFGHTGFTGTSLWIDPDFQSARGRGLVVALLTNEVYHGRVSRKIIDLRLAVHQEVVETFRV
jgi:serine-type D-Ala-D-Ala carboxypeptidase